MLTLRIELSLQLHPLAVTELIQWVGVIATCKESKKKNEAKLLLQRKE